jgi:uncharacterized protein with von Willebrand factor type A (vWA) domain
MPTVADPFTHNLVHFTRFLRAQGLTAVPDTTGLLMEAASAVGLDNREDTYLAFRAVTVSRPNEIPIFDDAFELFFGKGRGGTLTMDPIELNIQQRGPRIHLVAGTAIAADPGTDEIEATEQMGASAVKRLAHRDFSELTENEYAEVKRMVARMLWQPSAALSRRWVPSTRGARPDLRRTLRQLTGPTRDLMPLAVTAPKARRRPVLVIADVSGSMERYTEMLLYFIHAARGRLGKVEAFVFSTSLSRITRELKHRDPGVALARVGQSVHDWSSGTLIGEAFADFNKRWARRVTRGGPVAVVISDGWDRGDPALLRKQFGIFARSVYRVVWLNPLAGRLGFEPETRGMRTVLPLVDDFLPVGNLADLTAVVQLLESVPKRKEVSHR